MDLLERERPLEDLVAAVESAASGAGRLVLVMAEAGGGKTALVDAALATTSGQLLRGTCDDLVTPIPFGPLIDLARSADPGLEQALVEGDRERAFARLLDLVERKPHPVVLVIEDVHWIDQASSDLLSALAQRIDRLPLALVMTLRPEGLSPDHPARRPAWRAPPPAIDRIELRPLSPAALSDLAGPDLAPKLLEATGGNPFFVTEMLASGGVVTPDLTEAVMARASGLPAETLDLAELISISPTRAEGNILDMIRPGWEAVIEPAERIGLVSVNPGGVSFRHGLARQAFERHQFGSRRRARHAEMLQAVTSLGLGSARIVHHAAGAGDVEMILAVGPVAGVEARIAGSHREAAAHFRRVLEHADRLPGWRRAEIEEAYSLEAWTIDDAEEAEAAARRALELRRAEGGPSEAIRRNQRRIARVRWFLGDAPAAERFLEEAVAEPWSGSPEDRVELASALAYRGLIAGIRHSLEVARPWVERARAMVGDVVDPKAMALILNDIGTVQYLHQGDEADLCRSIEIAEHIGLHVDVVRGHVNLASGALAHRRYADAARHLDQACQYGERHQVAAFDALANAVRAQVLFETGDWQAAEAEVDRAMTHRSFARLPASIVLARLKVRRGDTDAGEAIRIALERAETTGEAQRVVPAIGAAAEHAWMRHRIDEIVPALQRAHRLAVASAAPRFIGETAVWLQSAGLLEEIPDPVEPAARMLLEGRWTDAATEWERLGLPYEAAAARVLAPDVEVVLAGLAELDRMGAVPMARRTRSRLARMGVERIPRGPRPATASNPAGLTTRQMQVLELVAEGQTNAEIAERLFLSTRTVDHHVAAILLKLEVESRRLVGPRARDLGLLD